MPLRWYVVHTYSGHEQKAKRYLESAIATAGLEAKFGQILIPTEQVTEMRQGKRSTSTKKFLPSYILVEMELDRESQNLVVSTPSITNFVGAAGNPRLKRNPADIPPHDFHNHHPVMAGRGCMQLVECLRGGNYRRGESKGDFCSF